MELSSHIPEVRDRLLTVVDKAINTSTEMLGVTERGVLKEERYENAMGVFQQFHLNCDRMGWEPSEIMMQSSLNVLFGSLLRGLGADMGNISIMPVIGNIGNDPISGQGKKELVEIGGGLPVRIPRQRDREGDVHRPLQQTHHMALRIAWKSKYPQERMPETYFTNPQGHYTADRFAWTINNEFRSTYTGLVADRDAPVLLFDTCMHNGRRMGAVMQTLERLKFRNVLVGIAQPVDKDDEPNIKPDFVALKEQAAYGCRPFGDETSIRKGKNVLSIMVEDYEEMEEARSLRRRITETFEKRAADKGLGRLQRRMDMRQEGARRSKNKG